MSLSALTRGLCLPPMAAMAGGPEEMYREMDHGLEGMYRETEKGFVCAKKRNFSGRHTHFRQQFGHKVAVLIVSSGCCLLLWHRILFNEPNIHPPRLCGFAVFSSHGGMFFK